MHSITGLHRALSTNFSVIHAKRLTGLLAAIEAVVTGNWLTLGDMGRKLTGATRTTLPTGCVPILITDTGFVARDSN